MKYINILFENFTGQLIGVSKNKLLFKLGGTYMKILQELVANGFS